jgi:hypothetical protein
MLEPDDQQAATVGAGGAAEGTGGAVAGYGGAGQATGGAGGTTYATGGIGGATSSTGGTGGGFLAGCQYPSCIWNLIRDCNASGPCTEDDSGSSGSAPMVYKLCCSGGVKEVATLNQSYTAIYGTLAVTKNGSKCYDVSVNASVGGSNVASYVWMAPDGQVVAKGSTMADGSVAIECSNGEYLVLSTGCSPDGSNSNSPANTGACQ